MSKELYRKKQLQEMFAWEEGLPMDIVSISEADRLNGSPKQGDMIAVNPKDGSDMWLVAKQFFEDNYEAALEAEPMEQEPAFLGLTEESKAMHPKVKPDIIKPYGGKPSKIFDLPLYTYPATNEVSTPFERLSDDEILSCIAPASVMNTSRVDTDEVLGFANAIINKIAEKNK